MNVNDEHFNLQLFKMISYFKLSFIEVIIHFVLLFNYFYSVCYSVNMLLGLKV